MLHGNYIVNSTITIKIFVNGHNKTLDSDSDNDFIFRLIEDIASDEIYEDDDERIATTEAPQSYEEIDKSIPIERGPLRIPHPQKIPLLRDVMKSNNNDDVNEA